MRKEERHRHGTNAVKNHRWKVKSQHIDILWDKEIPYESQQWGNYEHEKKVDEAERRAIATVEMFVGMYGHLLIECGNGNKLGGRHTYPEAHKVIKRWITDNYLDSMREAWNEQKQKDLDRIKCIDDTFEEIAS
jgi:hypothetical protein